MTESLDGCGTVPYDGSMMTNTTTKLVPEILDSEPCRECGAPLTAADQEAGHAHPVLFDDNGPGEPPSCDGFVCEACATTYQARYTAPPTTLTSEAHAAAEAAVLEAMERRQTLKEVIATCRLAQTSATLYGKLGMALGWVHASGSYRLR